MALVVVALLALLAPGPTPAAAQDDGTDLRLVAQSPGVEPGGTFALVLRPDGAPPGAQLRVAVRDRVRSRTELAATNDGARLRSTLHTETLPLAGVAPDANGDRRLVVDLGPTAPAGPAVRIAGVYPVEVEVLDASGRRLDRLLTHLVLRPAPGEGAPPLDVALVARVGAMPADPDAPPLDARALASRRAVLDALLAVPDVVATLAVSPDTLVELAAAVDEGSAALLDVLRAVASARPVLALPYVRTSPDALSDAGLATELAHQLDRGAAALQDVLGVGPSERTWLATPDLGAEGLQLLHALGSPRVVVAPDQVQRLTDGVLSPARPFLVTAPLVRDRDADEDDDEREPVALEALATDAHLDELLHGSGEPALVASRALADLAMLWFEQPSTPRAVVVPVDAAVHGSTARAVLEGLRASTMFRTVPLDDAFDRADPLRGSDGEVLRRTLEPEDPVRIGTSVAAAVMDLRSLRGSVEGMVGAGAPVLGELDHHLLRATAVGLSGRGRDREVDAARAVVDALAAAVEAPDQASITLTAREGTVPLTLRNTTGSPIEVQVRLRSPKLELPGGDTFALTLTDATSRLDIAVRARASGSFPVEIEVTSPDGRLRLASTRYSVRSTAVSGVGVVLSAGAGLFLIIWWARHWRESRRSAKLVAEPPGRSAG